MRSQTRLIAIGLIAILVAGCASSPQATPATPQPSTEASDSASPSAPASPSADPSMAPTTEPIPSDELGEFTCDLPIVEAPSVPLANLVDVRIGAHDGYDRVVFEFIQGTPELTLGRATPPLTAEGSGLPVDVEGESFLRLTMRGGSAQTDEGTSSYDGPQEFDADMTALVELESGGDFERQSTWYFGLAAESCLRVLLLDDPHRLVIDIEH